jgi:DNA-binding XRE family transcriptional regulator
MMLCQDCDKKIGCKALCVAAEEYVNQDYVGHGRANVYIQGPNLPHAPSCNKMQWDRNHIEWLEWMQFNKGADWPEPFADFGDIDRLREDVFSEIQLRAIKDRFGAGMKLREIAEKEGVSRQAIMDRIISAGKALRRYVRNQAEWKKLQPIFKYLTEAKQKVAFLRYHEGYSSLKVAKILGVSDTNVRYHLENMRVTQ